MQQEGWRMQRIEANGISIMTATAGRAPGEGPRLLYISGTGGDLRQATSALHLPLTETFEVLAYDQRGLGQTDKPPGPYSMEGYARDACAVMDAFGWDVAHVVGYSFGGMVAQELAIRWPERVGKLVLGATTAGGAGGSSFPLHEIQHLAARERAQRTIEVADLAFTPEWQRANPAAAEARIAQRMARQAEFADEPGHHEGQTAQLAARVHHDTFGRLGQIKAETLVLAGSRDGQAPIEAARAMAARIKQCRFEVHEGSHQMIQENAEVCRSITRFLLADD